MIYYKVLAADGCSPYHGGTGKWHLPTATKPGAWMPLIDNIKMCERGYHIVTQDQLLCWLGPTLYEVEVRGDIMAADDKSVVAQARLVRRIETWNDKTLRLFAADCAEHVLDLYERKYPADTRPRDAIKAARDLANGLTTKAAAYDAARDADAAANAAVYANDAAHAAYAATNAAAHAAARAAHAAARAAATAAAHAAAAYAADAATTATAERQWQLKQLRHIIEP